MSDGAVKPMSGEDVVFTVDQVAACSTALRTALGKPPEHFSMARFVSMISDEIEALRADGWAAADIAGLIAESTGSSITSDDIDAYYVSPTARGSRGG